MITALCGGVGGSKLVSGLYRSLPPNTLTVIVNTADDLEFCGLHVSPDLDTLTYTLANLAQRDAGWGIEGDTFEALQMLRRYGAPHWFQVGDRDLATDIFRTQWLQEGRTLSEVTDHVARSLGVDAQLLPMSDDAVATELLVDDQWIPFQEYFVLRHYRDEVTEVRYAGIEKATPTQPVKEAITSSEVIVLVNSNPILSILPILSVPGVRKLLQTSSSPRVAVSPFIGQEAVSGPAAKLMSLAGYEPTSAGLAGMYKDVIDAVIIAEKDAHMAPEIAGLGMQVFCTDILMRTEEDRGRLASETLDFARSLR